jgi:hypothetical protein
MEITVEGFLDRVLKRKLAKEGVLGVEETGFLRKAQRAPQAQTHRSSASPAQGATSPAPVDLIFRSRKR